MAAHRLSPLASATRALGARPRHLQRHRLRSTTAPHDAPRRALRPAPHGPARRAPRRARRRWRPGAARTASARRWSAASSSAPAAPRSASCARAASPGPRGRSTRRGATCAPACTSTGGHVALARRDELPVEPARRPPAGRPAARPPRRAVRRGRRRGLLGRAEPVRLRHHRRPLPARGARPRAAARCWPSPATAAPTTRRV